MKLKERTALVTGAARGIGVEVSRQLGKEGARILLGVRDEEKGEQFKHELELDGIQSSVLRIDLSDISSVQSCLNSLNEPVDILINNAALYDRGRDLLSVSDSEIELILKTNLIGSVLLAKHLATGMKKRRWGRIVNVSSGMGSIGRGFGADSPAYRISKLGINGLTLTLANALRGTGVLVNSVDPGWVRTEMGGPSATRSLEQGSRSIVWAVFIPDNGPTGGFFYDGNPAVW